MPYVGNQPTSVAFLTDTFNGTGSATAFTLSAAPATTSSILVAVSGVLQDPSTYSVSGTTLTFSAAPPSGTGNISVRFLGIPASGVVTTAYRTQTEFTATAGQTTFSVPSYTVGYIDVYRNGVLLGSADFTATNGTTVVLAAGASAGDLVETVSFYVSSVVNAIPATAGSVGTTYLQTGLTVTSPVFAGTPTGVGVLTSGTSQASTSGTSIDFTGIPSWVKRITVMFNGVSTNGSSLVIVQLGTSSGVETSSYLGNSQQGGSPVAFSTGFIISTAAAAASVRYGAISIALLNSNVWTVQGVIADTNNTWTTPMAGVKSLSSTLDRVRITTVNGTDTFDAGTINILYE